MKIHVLGGGPAGLYFSILHKVANPASDVTVFERNKEGESPGWGVVFSDETLGNLEEADAETFRAITDRFVYWDAIDVHVDPKDRPLGTVRSGGHGFCGIARHRLLALLCERARSLGVKIEFETEITDPLSMRECDLLVAADGVWSRTRGALAEHFQPSIEYGKARYIWLGTTQSFEAFTFVLRENAAGVFQVHAYQFEPGTSTFIVECDEETFSRSGLAEDDEAAAVAYCQELFQPELQGHALMANRSRWIRFPTVKNERWHHGNIVLLGDAAHTAHFSIGSGTKLAMEDAIVLHRALEASASDAESKSRNLDLEAALHRYEEDRRPLVGRSQKAASQSQTWFEETSRHIMHTPERIAFSLLSRTRRITHDNLQMRDAPYIASLDENYATEQELGERELPPFLQPFKLRGLALDNRIVVSPMCQYSATDGVPNDWHLVHLGSRAIGGAGLVFVEMTNVSADARITPGCTGIYNDAQVDAWRNICDFIHTHSRAKVAMQLGHAGRKGATKLMWEGMDAPLEEGAWPLIAPSAIPWSEKNQVPREMTREDMIRVREDFVRAAKASERAGFDILEVHLAHGYLLSSFLTPLSNQRRDEYGGSQAARFRYPLEVVDAVRQVWDKPLSVRISATDWVEDKESFDLNDALALSAALKDLGVDLIDVSTGQTSTDAAPVYGRAYQMPFSERIRNEVGIPTLTVGNIWTADQANTILLAGRADLVALARAHLADPYATLHEVAKADLALPKRWPVQYRSGESMARRMFGPPPSIEQTV